MEGAGCRRSKELRIPWGQAMRFVLLAAIIRFNLEGNRGCTAFWRGWSPALPPAEGVGKRAGEEKKKKAPAQVAPEPFGLEQAMGIELQAAYLCGFSAFTTANK